MDGDVVRDAPGRNGSPPRALAALALPLEPSTDAWQSALDVDLLSEWLLADDSAGTSSEPGASSSSDSISSEQIDASPLVLADASAAEVVDGPRLDVDALALVSSTALSPRRSDNERAVSLRDRKARRRAKDALLARSIRRRKKSEKLALCEQVAALTAQLASLREARKLQLRGDGAAAEWEERAVAQRMARRHTLERNLQLKRAFVAQRAFLLGLNAVVAGSSTTGAELDLRALLHSYTRLRADPASRARDLEASCSDERLDVAVQIVSRETEFVAVESPSITARPLRSQRPSEVGWTLVGVYTLDTKDVRRVFGAAHSALLSASCVWPAHTLLSAQSNVLDAPASNVSYCASHTRYLNDASGEQVAVETRRISHYRVTDTCAVLSWDYPDVDDAYPTRDDASLRRDLAGAALVRREVCPDGVERAVCRIICTAVTSGSGASADVTRQFLQHLPQAGHASAIMAYEYITGQAQAAT